MRYETEPQCEEKVYYESEARHQEQVRYWTHDTREATCKMERCKLPRLRQRLHRSNQGDPSDDRTCMSLEIDSSLGINSSEWTTTIKIGILQLFTLCENNRKVALFIKYTTAQMILLCLFYTTHLICLFYPVCVVWDF